MNGLLLAQLGYLFERDGERLIEADSGAAVEYERLQAVAEALFAKAVDAGFDGGLNEAFCGEEERAWKLSLGDHEGTDAQSSFFKGTDFQR